GRREHDLVDARRLCRAQQRYRAGDIVLIEISWIADRFGYFNRRGKMNDGTWFVLGENLVEPPAVANISCLKRPPFDEFGVPAREIVEYDGSEALAEQIKTGVGSDIARSTSDKDICHRLDSPRTSTNYQLS